jgi:hypothetical protein
MPENESFWKLRFSDLLVIGLALLTFWVTWTIGATEGKQNDQISQLKVIASNDTITIAKLTTLIDSQTSIINRLSNIYSLTGNELAGIQRQIRQLEGLNRTEEKTFQDGHASLEIIKEDMARNLIYDQKAFTNALNRISTDIIGHVNESVKYINDSAHSLTPEIKQVVSSWVDQLYIQLENLLSNKYVQNHFYIAENVEAYLGFANVARIFMAQGKNRQLVVSRALWRSIVVLNYFSYEDSTHNKMIEDIINNTIKQMSDESNRLPY